ncbi:MAG: hypothetical protein QOG75_6133 [Mycobacterium sp.]|jgi:hypothetical protein|nr:hypothetical protein [Mycobacterium sp.]
MSSSSASKQRLGSNPKNKPQLDASVRPFRLDRCPAIVTTVMAGGGEQGRAEMSKVPSRQARLARAAKHAELWNAAKKDEWVASWRTICPGDVRMFEPVGTEEKHGFEAATSDAFDMFQSILKIKMIAVQLNGGTEPNAQMAHGIETFAWDDDGDLLIKSYYPMPESVGAEADPDARLLGGAGVVHGF